MRPTTIPLPADMLLGNDTIREVLSIVASDERQETIGLHATVRGVLARRLGAPPERGNRGGRRRRLLGCLRGMPRRCLIPAKLPHEILTQISSNSLVRLTNY